MKLAHWAEGKPSYDDNYYLVNTEDCRYLFIIERESESSYICYGYGDFYYVDIGTRSLSFDSLNKAKSHCKTLVKSKGYRVLTEAEMNLL